MHYSYATAVGLTILFWVIVLVALRYSVGLSVVDGQFQIQYNSRNLPLDSSDDPLSLDFSTHTVRTSIIGGAFLLTALVGVSLVLVNGVVFVIRHSDKRRTGAE